MGNAAPRFIIPSPDHALRTLSSTPNRRPPTLPVRTSVLVWNLQKGQAAGFADAFERLVAGRALVLLQEMHIHDDKSAATTPEAFFVADSDRSYAMATSFVYGKDQTPTGVAIGAAIEPAAGMEWQVTEDLEPLVGTPKASLLALFRLPGENNVGTQAWCGGGDGGGSGEGKGDEDDTSLSAASVSATSFSPAASSAPSSDSLSTTHFLLVATVHGLNRASNAAFERQIDRLAARLEAHDGPLLLAGDFNTQSARKLGYLETTCGRLGMAAVQFTPDGRTVSKLSRRPLDHAFVRGLAVENAACWGGVGGSDHVAMTFDIMLC